MRVSQPRRRWFATLLIAIVALAALGLPAGRWLRRKVERIRVARAEQAAIARARPWVIPIASRKYREHFGEPAPTARPLPAGEVAYTSIRWDRSRRAYIVAFVHQWVVNQAHDSRGRPIPYTSGYTVTESFAVKPGGNCEYVDGLSGGPY